MVGSRPHSWQRRGCPARSIQALLCSRPCLPSQGGGRQRAGRPRSSQTPARPSDPCSHLAAARSPASSSAAPNSSATARAILCAPHPSTCSGNWAASRDRQRCDEASAARSPRSMPPPPAGRPQQAAPLLPLPLAILQLHAASPAGWTYHAAVKQAAELFQTSTGCCYTERQPAVSSVLCREAVGSQHTTGPPPPPCFLVAVFLMQGASRASSGSCDNSSNGPAAPRTVQPWCSPA